MSHETVLTVFVIVAALALVAQAGIFYGIYHAIQRIHIDVQEATSGTKQHLEELKQLVAQFLTDSREPVRSITTNLAEITKIVRDRTTQVDAVVADLVDRTRLQIIRVDQMVTGVVEKVETTAAAVERGVVAPVEEASAVIQGVRRGLEVLFSRRRATTAREATQDEQMFI
jgi:methyl-accepting chemotaxis protein